MLGSFQICKCRVCFGVHWDKGCLKGEDLSNVGMGTGERGREGGREGRWEEDEGEGTIEEGEGPRDKKYLK